jgi:hypothetical protein
MFYLSIDITAIIVIASTFFEIIYLPHTFD